jgi:hypothetical protein
MLPKNSAELIRSAFKTSDQVQGQGADRAGKRSIHGYVSIYRSSATQPLVLRWGFETTSRFFWHPKCQPFGFPVYYYELCDLRAMSFN